jgi:hypothetical protein
MNLITFNSTIENGVIRVPRRFVKNNKSHPVMVQIAYRQVREDCVF